MLDLVSLGLTYRRVDHWTRRGYLRADNPNPGSGRGREREYPAGERAVADVMRRLTAVGVTVDAAHRAARQDGWLGPGVRVVLCEPTGCAA